MGAGIEQDHAEWSRADTGEVVWNDYGPNGYTNPAGGAGPQLLPGTDYRVRVRSRNVQGWGAFSGYVYAQTLSGGRAFDGSTFRNCRVRTWDGSQWRLVRARTFNGSGFQNVR
jgi:hypothetical protein